MVQEGYRPVLGLKFERAEMQRIRWMCGISIKGKTHRRELSLSHLSLEVVD